MVLELIRLVLEGEVMLDRSSWEFGFLILSGADGRDSKPESSKNGNARKQGEEDGSLQTTADLP